MGVIKASMCQEMDALPDDMLIIHDQWVDAGQHQEISHPGQPGVVDRDTPVICTGDHYRKNRVDAESWAHHSMPDFSGPP